MFSIPPYCWIVNPARLSRARLSAHAAIAYRRVCHSRERHIAVAVAAPAATLAGSVTKRVNVSSAEAEARGGWSWSPSVSATGRYVAFTTKATNLAPGDRDDRNDVYLRDIRSGTTKWLSYTRSGTSNNGDSRAPSISSSGRFVAFESAASTIIGSDTNGLKDIFIHDRYTGKTRLVSKDRFGGLANNGSSDPDISADGRFAAFRSTASDLISNDTNNETDVFRRGSFR